MKTKLTILFLLLSMIVLGQNKINNYTPTNKAQTNYIQGNDTISIIGDSNIWIGKDTINATKILADGTMIAIGNATCWKDQLVPFNTGSTAGTGYPAFIADSMYYNFVLDSTGGSKCMQYHSVQINHDWVEGTTVFPHVHYKYYTAIGVPKFRIKYRVQPQAGMTGIMVSQWQWLTLDQNTGTTNFSEQIVYNATGISCTNRKVSCIIECQLYLYDTPTNIGAIQFDIHYQTDGIGSRTEFNK